MRDTPLVTVLLPAFNAEKYISESIDSIVNQSYQNLEILVINDGSTDHTKKIIKSYSDDRIELINHDRNKGLIYSLNEGLELSKGKYIARMDADDISLPRRIEKQVEYMEANENVGVCAAWIEIFEGEKDYIWKTSVNHEDIIARALFETPIAHPSVLIRKKVIKDNKLKYQEKYKFAEDYKLWIEIGRISKLHSLPMPLLKYRVHSLQTGKSKKINQIKTARNIRKEQLVKMGIDPTKKEIETHEMLSNLKKVDDLIFLKKWINKISNVNKMNKVYDQVSLEKIIMEKWIFAISVCGESIIKKLSYALFPGKHISKSLLFLLLIKHLIR